MLLTLVTSSLAVMDSSGAPTPATDWILTLGAPDTVYPGADIIARVSLKIDSPLPRYVYPWMTPGLRQNTTGECDVGVQSEDGAAVPKTIYVHTFIAYREVKRGLFAASDSMSTYEFVYQRFYQRSNRDGKVLPPGVYQLTATCRLSESIPGAPPRTVYLQSTPSSVVVARPPEQYAAAHSLLLLTCQRCQESRDPRRRATRDAELGQLRSLASTYAGTRIGAWAAIELMGELVYDLAYGRSTGLGRVVQEAGDMLLANAGDASLVPVKTWLTYRFVSSRDKTLADALLTRLASATAGTPLAQTARRIAQQETGGADGGVR